MKGLIVLAVLAACTGGPATSTVEQGAFYCYNGVQQPFMCYPWNWDGDWNWCQRNCSTYEGTDGYCPESTPLEWEFCWRSENRSNIHCTLDGQPRFPHHCVTGEFPLTEDEL